MTGRLPVSGGPVTEPVHQVQLLVERRVSKGFVKDARPPRCRYSPNKLGPRTFKISDKAAAMRAVGTVGFTMLETMMTQEVEKSITRNVDQAFSE